MTTLRFKNGVMIFGFQPEALWAIDRCVEVWERHGIAYCTVTSGRGDDHGDGSLHFAGLAPDVRSRGLSNATLDKLIPDLKKTLGKHYDVVLEHSPPHIHIEYQPKSKPQYPMREPYQ